MTLFDRSRAVNNSSGADSLVTRWDGKDNVTEIIKRQDHQLVLLLTREIVMLVHVESHSNVMFCLFLTQPYSIHCFNHIFTYQVNTNSINIFTFSGRCSRDL